MRSRVRVPSERMDEAELTSVDAMQTTNPFSKSSLRDPVMGPELEPGPSLPQEGARAHMIT